MTNPIPAPTQHLLDLFDGPLRDVRFPDADVERLTQSVAEIHSAHEALVRAQREVDAAQQRLLEAQDSAGKQTDRTLAYVRIYATDKPELLAALGDVTARRGRGRPRKGSVATPVAPSEAAE
jgi:hypothetical protein